jgi:hypothetical protein
MIEDADMPLIDKGPVHFVYLVRLFGWRKWLVGKGFHLFCLFLQLDRCPGPGGFDRHGPAVQQEDEMPPLGRCRNARARWSGAAHAGPRAALFRWITYCR